MRGGGGRRDEEKPAKINRGPGWEGMVGGDGGRRDDKTQRK